MIHFDISNDFIAIKYQDGSSPFLTEIFLWVIKYMLGLVCDSYEEKINREGWRLHQPFVS